VVRKEIAVKKYVGRLSAEEHAQLDELIRTSIAAPRSPNESIQSPILLKQCRERILRPSPARALSGRSRWRKVYFWQCRSMDSAEQIDDTQQDGPSDEDQQRRVHDRADRFTSFCQVSPFH
jgi:hypothetical protein